MECVSLVGHLSNATDKVFPRQPRNVDGYLVSRFESLEEPFPTVPIARWAVSLVCFGIWADTFASFCVQNLILEVAFTAVTAVPVHTSVCPIVSVL